MVANNVTRILFTNGLKVRSKSFQTIEYIDSYFESKIEFEIECVSIREWLCFLPAETYNSFGTFCLLLIHMYELN